LRAEEKNALDFEVVQQLFMYRFLRNKMNSAQGEALSSFGRKIAMMSPANDFISEVGFPLSTYASP
jgi:hypothetical protein